ncbi:MAG: hypothetical protein ACYS8I_00185 [Planctomycetota bacterium]|jgi:hypothetical protein
MKDIYKNPMLYYILVPVALALWPSIIAAIYLPKANKACNLEIGDLNKARGIIAEILTIDPARLEFSDAGSGAAEFDYYDAVDKVAASCNLPPAKKKVTVKPVMEKNKQKTRECNVVLKDVSIATFAKFLSTIQLRWGRLECLNARLTRKRGLADKWQVTLDFKYRF